MIRIIPNSLFLKIFSVCLLGVLLLSACDPGRPLPLPTETFSPASPTTTPTTPRPTRTPTQRPSATLTLTQTPRFTRTTRPTRTPTITPYPTLAPATPQAGAEAYRLAEWSPQRAAELATLAEANLPSESIEFDMQQYDAYISQFLAAASALSLSYQEALLRAPTDPLSGAWQSGLVYAQAVSDDTATGNTLTHYLISQLSGGAVTFENLKQWLSLNFIRPPGFPYKLVSTLTQVHLPPVFSEGYLLHTSNGAMGAVCTVLAKDQVGYHGVTLISSFYYSSAVGVHQEIDCKVEDLTGDGIDEVIIIFEWGGHLSQQNIQMFSLDQWPPRPLELDPEVAHSNGDIWPSRYYFSDIVSDASPHRLQLWLWPSSWNCWIYVDSTYKWNGLWLAQEKYAPAEGDHYADPWCADMLNLPLTPLKLRPVFLEKFLAAQPGSDSLRYQLGLQQALQSDAAQAVQTLEGLLAAPTDPQSEWVQKARRFLATYTAADQIYAACSQVADCAPGEGLAALARQMPPERLASAPERLKAAGVPLLKSGNLLASDALWFTVRFPGSQYPELWLLEAQGSGLAATLVSDIAGSFSPPVLVANGAPNGFKLYQAGDVLFLYAAAPDGGESYVELTRGISAEPENDHQRFGQLRSQLLAGGNPMLLLAEMQALRQQMTLNDGELYLYGLAAELAGQDEEAVGAYWQLWQEFPDSPYANLARFKLGLR